MSEIEAQNDQREPVKSFRWAPAATLAAVAAVGWSWSPEGKVLILVKLADRLPKGGAFAEWTNLWTAEEGQHAIALRSYLLTSRNADPRALEDDRMAVGVDHLGRNRSRQCRRNGWHQCPAAGRWVDSCVGPP